MDLEVTESLKIADSDHRAAVSRNQPDWSVERCARGFAKQAMDAVNAFLKAFAERGDNLFIRHLRLSQPVK